MNNTKKMLSGIIAVISVMTSAVSCNTTTSHTTGSLSIEPTSAESSIVETTKETTMETTSETIVTETTTTTTTTTPEVEEPVPLEDPVDVHGTEIVWLSDYDLNPQAGSERPVAVALFEDVFGGKIKFVQTSARNKLTTLSQMLISGEEVDMFGYEYGEFPKGVLSEQYQPLDPYFRSMGMNYNIWDDMEETIDMFEYKNQHYVIPTSLSNPTVLMYSRSIIKNYDLDDPYELYKKGQWNWDTFLDISGKYRTKTNKPAIRGNIGSSALHSGGGRVISNYNGKLVNNVNSAPVRYAELFMQELSSQSLYSSAWGESYTTDTLFFAYDSWALGTSNVYNPDMDLMIVPFPKSPKAEKYSVVCDFNAKMLVKNSTKGDAVATYIQCERIAATQEDYKEAAKQYAIQPEKSSNGAIKSYITAEQYDALQEFTDPSKITPVFDYGYGMNDSISGSGGVMANLENTFLINGGSESDWKILRNSCSDIIKEVIKEYQ